MNKVLLVSLCKSKAEKQHPAHTMELSLELGSNHEADFELLNYKASPIVPIGASGRGVEVFKKCSRWALDN